MVVTVVKIDSRSFSMVMYIYRFIDFLPVNHIHTCIDHHSAYFQF